MNALQGNIAGNMRKYGIKADEVAGSIGKSKSTFYRLIRQGNIKYSDLRIVSDVLHFSKEQKAEIL